MSLLIICYLLALAALVGEYGMYLGESAGAVARAVAVVAAIGFIAYAVMSLRRREEPRQREARAVLAAAAVAGVCLMLLAILSSVPGVVDRAIRVSRTGSLMHLRVAIVHLFLFSSMMLFAGRVVRRLGRLPLRPILALMLAFVTVVIIGAAALALPKSTPGRAGLPAIDAAFTSVSAVCLTGLSTVDTTAFTRTGQIIVLLLMQWGGLAIMVFAAFVWGMLCSTRDMAASPAARDLDADIKTPFAGRVAFITIFALSVEAAGALILYVLLPEADHTWVGRAFFALFHAVSSFCNAGFSVYGRGMEPFYDDVLINVVIMGLIVMGGLGFVVHRDLFRAIRHIAGQPRRPVRLSLHSKLALAGTLGLLLAGAIGVYVFESGKLSILEATFQSVTARSAGFQTTPQEALGGGSLVVTIVLMIVGGAPGSTAGGIKITTALAVLAALASAIRRRDDLRIGSLVLPRSAGQQSVAVLGFSVFAMSLSLVILLLLEAAPLRELAFETVSAFGSVGLSVGHTSRLSTGGKIVVLLVMFAGRVGPPAVAVAVAMRSRRGTVTDEGEPLLIG